VGLRRSLYTCIPSFIALTYGGWVRAIEEGDRMSGSASIRDSRMKFAKGVLSAFMAVVTVVGFTPIVPYQAHADELETASPAAAQVVEGAAQPSAQESVDTAQTPALSDATTQADSVGAATQGNAQLAPASDDSSQLEPAVGVSCVWNNQYYETLTDAIEAIEADDTVSEATITMIGNSQESKGTSISKKITLLLEGKTLEMGEDVIYVVDGANAAVTISDSQDSAVIRGTDMPAFIIQSGVLTLESGKIVFDADSYDSYGTAVVVAPNPNASFYMHGGEVSATNGNDAVITGGIFSMDGGALNGGILARESADVDIVGTSAWQANGSAAAPTIYSEGVGVTVEDSANVSLVHASVSAKGAAVDASGGNVIVDNTSLTSTAGAGMRVTGGSVVVQNASFVAALAEGLDAINVSDAGFVEVYSESASPTILQASEDHVVGGDPDCALVHANVLSSNKVPYQAVESGYVCTYLDSKEMWTINKAPNAPVAVAPVLDYADWQNIVDLKGGQIVGDPTEYDGRVVADTDAGYTLEYDNSASAHDGDEFVQAKRLGEYRVIATLLDGFTWADGTTNPKVVQTAIVADIVNPATAAENVVYSGEAQSLYDFETGTNLTNGGTVTPDDGGVTYNVVNTNKGYTIYYLDGAGITVDFDADKITAVNAGEYDILVHLDEPANYTWPDGTTGEFTVTGTIQMKSVPIPSAVKNVVYTGSAQKIIDYGEGVTYESGAFPVHPIVTSAGYSIENTGSGVAPERDSNNDIAATLATTYTLTASLAPLNTGATPNYMWEDETTADKVIEATIDRAPVEVPVAIDELVYNGKAQQIIDLGEEGEITSWNYDDLDSPTEITALTNLGYIIECTDLDGFTLSEGDHGQLVGVNAGEYGAFTATLDGNHVWSDDSTEAVSVTGLIARQPVSAPEALTGLTYTGAYQQVIDLGGYEVTNVTPSNDLTETNKAETDGGYYIVYPEAENGLKVSSNQFTAKAAGTYANVVAYVDDNHAWSEADEGTETNPVTLNPTIGEAVITVPTVSVEGNTTEWTGKPIELVDLQGAVVLRSYEHEGETIAYTNKGYSLVYPLNVTYDNGKLYATSVGSYNIKAYRDSENNYVWSDEVLTSNPDPREFNVSIVKIETPAPTKVNHEAYVYDGTEKPLVDLGDATIVSQTVDPITGRVTLLTDSGYSLEYPAGVTVAVDVETGCLVGTAAGDYAITAVLDEGHEWASGDDPDAPIVFGDSIARQQIEKPIPDPSSFEYTGEPQVLVEGGEGYTLTCDNPNVTIDAETGDAIAKEIGDYKITATLDSNYAWASDPDLDPDIDPFVAEVSIDRIIVDKPEYEPLITYTGEPQVLVAGGEGYTLSTEDSGVTIDEETGDALATEVGDYTITATLDEHYAWDADPATDPIKMEVTISEFEVAVPEAVSNLEYTGEAQVIVPGNEHYQLKINNGEWLEPGVDATAIENQNYVVYAKLVNPGDYVWPDDTTENKTINAMISKGKIAVPDVVSELVYNGDAQVIAKGSLGKYGLVPSAEALAAGAELNQLTGDISATKAGTYRISATLADPDHYMWSNGAIIDQELDAVIAKKPIDAPVDMVEKDYVPGGQLVLEASDDYTFAPGSDDPIAVITEAGVTVENAGTYSVVASLNDTTNTEWADKASGVKVSTITVNPKLIEAPEVVADELVYDPDGQVMVAGGEGYQLTVNDGEPLAEGSDAIGTDAGDYKIVASLSSSNYRWDLIGNLDGMVHLECTINPAKVEKPTAAEGLVYNRAAQTLVKGGEGYTLGLYNGGLHMSSALPDPDATFPEGEDATAINANEYTVIAKLVNTNNYVWADGLEAGIPGYDTDPVELDTEISAAPISQATVTASNMAYTGAPLEPAATVKIGDATLTYGTDYTVEYSNNKEVGTATITVTGKGNYTGTATGTFKIVESVPMFRLYNPNSGEHFYTQSTNERDNLKKVGWQYEGIGWYAPSSSNTPVYRLYNPNGGDHHYTVSVNERDMLTKAGWKYEGIGWYSDDAMGVKVLREYNPNATSGSHNFTTSETEHQNLVKLGWRDEGTAWYAVAVVS